MDVHLPSYSGPNEMHTLHYLQLLISFGQVKVEIFDCADVTVARDIQNVLPLCSDYPSLEIVDSSHEFATRRKQLML